MIITLTACAYIIDSYKRATVFNPSPNNQETIQSSDEFPVVDWEYWQNINSDIIGWITIPDTKINYPIVQAHSSDRTYYLYHDVYQQWNFCGAIYLDADNEDKGLSSQNCVILGHNMATNRDDMFTAISYYMDEEFAKSHSKILIQSPENKYKLEAKYVDNIKGSSAMKQTLFNNKAAFKQYIQNTFDSSKLKIDSQIPKTDQMWTLCSCSYYFNPANERTLVYAF